MTKLQNLTAATNPEGVDLVYVVVDPSGTPLDRKVTIKNFLKEAFGQISVEGSSWSPSTGSTWEQFDEFDTAIDNSTVAATADSSGQEIDITGYEGWYRITATAEIDTTSSGGITVRMAPYFNGAALHTVEQTFAFMSLPGKKIMSIDFIANLDASSASIDEVELWFWADGTNITVESAVLNVQRIA